MLLNAAVCYRHGRLTRYALSVTGIGTIYALKPHQMPASPTTPWNEKALRPNTAWLIENTLDGD